MMQSMKIKLPPEIIAQIKRPNKYHAQRTLYAGQWYDSKAEAKRAEDLDQLVLAGRVTWWLRQVPVMVGEPGVDRMFRVDFLVAEPCFNSRAVHIHAEDVKGVETASFRRHVRQWRLRGPVDLHVLGPKTIEVITKPLTK
jgi:hypothetical protein